MSDNEVDRSVDTQNRTGGRRSQTAPPEPNDLTQQAGSVQYGESVTDIFSRPDTKQVLLQTVAIFAALGIGYGLFGYIAIDSLASGGGEGEPDFLAEIGGFLVAAVTIIMAALIGPAISIISSIRTNGILSYLKDDLSYATCAVGAAAGQLVLMIVATLFATTALPSEWEIGIGEFTGLIALSVLVTGITAAASMYAVRGISDPIRPDN